jgi:recombinational DNA repair ATPase RecF
MARIEGQGGFAVVADVGDIDIGTGAIASAPERRQVRINGAPASVNSLSEWLAVLWLTPAMDRLFSGSGGDRRRFLDRLVLALEPSHAHHATRYDAAMRARNKLLADERWDEVWLASLELAMAEHGTAISAARERTVGALEQRLADVPDDQFARASIALEGWEATDLASTLAVNRTRDARAGRTTEGPHRQDLAVTHRTKAMPAARVRTVTALGEASAAVASDDFPSARLLLDGWAGGDLAATLRANRGRDAAAGRATAGPHRQDLSVTHLTKNQPAARSSTGEQKALLLGLVLAHAELVTELRGKPPILLLDEVAAHLDPARRAALFLRLAGRGQVWMTATEAALFDGIGEASRFLVEPGRILPR